MPTTRPVQSLSPNRPLAVWLFACCALIFAMVVLGGVTRLTGSGLSIVEWEPIVGTVPPLSDDDWSVAFDNYRQFPEYQKKNAGMTLEAFKTIYWFEYSHRLLGRLIGAAFLVPFLIFLALGRIERRYVGRFVTMFILGGLQGALGWYMVMSGLASDPHVSQYRLTAHLAAALAIYAYIFWTALGLWNDTTHAQPTVEQTAPRRFVLVVAGFVVVTILSGGFVAGLKAGFAFNTFPKMGDTWIAPGILAQQPWWRNLFENAATVQFDHRILALTTLVLAIALWVRSRLYPLNASARYARHLLLLAVLVQVTLGISTLLLHVPTPLAAAHQAGAVLVLTAVLFFIHALTFAHRGTLTAKDRAAAGETETVAGV